MTTVKKIFSKKSILFAVFCVAIGFITAFSGTLGIFAKAAEPVTYLQDIRLWEGESSVGAQTYFNSIGYTTLAADLNPSTDTGKYVYIGYKTTTDKSKALTDIRMMAMDTGYQMYNYKGIQDYLAAQQDGTAQSMYSAANEFAAYYKMGSPKALEAYEGLNLFDIGDADKTKLGDYIIRGGATKEFFVKMLLNSSSGAINNVIGLLNIGIAPYENNYDMDTQSAYTANWAERIVISTLWDDMEAGLTRDEEDELHKQYNDLAKKLFSCFQDFTTCYENAAARYTPEKEEALKKDERFKSVEDAVEKVDEIKEEDADPLFIAAYKTLNQYQFNERMKLGDWILMIGRQTADKVDLMQLYPVVEAMTDNQVEIISRTGLVSAIANLSENTDLPDYEEQVEKTKEVIRDYNGGTTISLWDVQGEDLKNAKIAFTSDAVRKQKAEQSLGVTSEREKLDEECQRVLKWINIAVGAAFVLVGIAEVALKICVFCAAAETAFSAFCISALSIVSWTGIGLLVVSLLLLAFQLIWALVMWIIEKIDEIDKDRNHTEKPDYLFDAPDTAKGTITVRYKSVLNNENKVGDLNAAKQYKWCLLAVTSDTRVGSPIRADSEGRIFNVIYGDSAAKNGYDSIRFFGERNVANTNAYCEKDKGGGCYVHYRTEKSIEGASPDADSQGETSGSNSYVEDLIVATGKNAAEAKAKIVAKDKKFYVLDANLSPGCSFATYVGYTITNDKSKAVRDIRVAPYAGKPEGVPTNLGSNSYNFVENVGVYIAVGDEQTRPQADALYYSKDEKAGTPILADGLHVVNGFANVQPGWEPVSLFGADYPYDFRTAFTVTEEDYPQFFSGFNTTSQNAMVNYKGTYFYYEPETKYTSGTKYLSGFFFIGGRNYEYQSDDYETYGNIRYHLITEKYSSLENYAKSIPNTVVLGNGGNYNLASSLRSSIDFGKGTQGYWVHPAYTYTYNPYRAVYDVAVFQGSSYSDSLAYNITKLGDNKMPLNYVSCSYIGQQSYRYGIMSRYIGLNNTFRDSGGLNFRDIDIERVRAGHTLTSKFARNVKFGYATSDYLAAGLYVLGYTKGKEPIKLDDIVVTDKSIKGKLSGTSIGYSVKGLKTLAGTDATGDFHSISELKDPHSTEPLNLCYGTFFNSKGTDTNESNAGEGKQGSNMFIYLRNPEPAKPKYISSLSIGSYSRNQYKSKNSGADENTLKAVDAMVDTQALTAALAGCTDEVIYTNLAIANQSSAWYNKTNSDGEGDRTPPEGNVAAYIGVNRTDKKEEAITGVLLYQINDSVAPNTVKFENVEYTCAGVQVPIEMRGKNYFLYYTVNTGIAPGSPITEIMVNNEPMTSGYATNRCADKNHDVPFGEPAQTNFIHLKYDKETRDIFTKLYIGQGSNKRAALCDLLSQGCFEYVDMDLNTGIAGKSIYLGYRSKHIDWDSINASATEKIRQEAIDKALTEAVYDIVLTRGESFKSGGFIDSNNVYYYPVSGRDLTGGAGDEIYMYYCCPYYSGNYNSKNQANTKLPADAFTGYYTQIGMTNYDRVPYNKNLSGKNVTAWEYIMFSDNSRPANPNAGTVAYSYADYYALDNRVNMFAQRSDGSVKPAGQITGGHISETEAQGSLTFIRDK